MDEQEKELEEILRMFDKAPSPSSENSVQNQAQQNNKQPRQIPQRQRCSQQTVHSSKQSSKKGKFQSNQGRNLSLKRQLAGKRRLKKQFAKKISSPANLYLRHGKKSLLIHRAVVMLLALQYLNYALVVFCLPDSRNKSQDCLFVLCCYNEDSGGVNMKDKKYYINLTEQERSQIIHSLIDKKNALMAQGRYTDAVDEVILKLMKAKKKACIVRTVA